MGEAFSYRYRLFALFVVAGITISTIISIITVQLLKSRYIEDALLFVTMLNLLFMPAYFLLAFFASKAYRRLKNKQQVQEELLIQKSKMAAIGEMISFISHQWRQPLNALSSSLIRIRTDFHLGRISDEEMERWFDAHEKRLEHLSDTIETFYEFYSPSHKEGSFELGDTIKQVMDYARPNLKEHAITLECTIGDEAWIKGRKNELMQVLLCCIGNAKKIFGERGVKNPRITISTVHTNGEVVISIEDNGGGIDVTPLAKIFEPYYTTCREKEGSGIGLFISKLLMRERFGGDIDAINAKEGARFIITLPGHLPATSNCYHQ